MARKKSLILAQRRLEALKLVLMEASEQHPIQLIELKSAVVELVDVFLLLLTED